LDETKGHRRRAKQIVTKSTGQVEMEVSPHLYIYTHIRTSTASLRSEVEAAFSRLKPVYEMVKSEAEHRKPTRPKDVRHAILATPQLVTLKDLSPPDATDTQAVARHPRSDNQGRETEQKEVKAIGR
jgi:hypothetical protein